MTEGRSFPIGRQTRRAIGAGAVVALAVGGICFVALIVGAAQGQSPPVGGVIAFVVIGLVFLGFGVLLASGSVSQRRNAKRWGARSLLVDAVGLHEYGNSFGPIDVAWSELAGLEIVASDYGGGYTPYRVPSSPNGKSALGVTTGLRMYPVDPDAFARRLPFYAPQTGSAMRREVVGNGFGAAYYTEQDIRADLVAAVRHYTSGRLGTAVDETRRARYRGSQF